MSKKLIVAIPIIFLIVISSYFILTTIPFVRYWVDDFCSATLLRNNGYFATQAIWWKGWTGRFLTTAVVSFFELFNMWVVRIIPLILIGGLVASFWRVYKFTKILPLLFVFLVLINAPNIIQSFYWMSGSIVYVAPFIFLNLFLTLLIFPPKKVNLIVPGILLFIAGGFDESYAVSQVVLLFFAFLFFKLTRFSKDKDRLRILYSGLVGSIFSLSLMFLAPGNAARATTVTHPASLLFVAKSTLYGTKWYLLRTLSVKPFLYSLFMIFVATLVFLKNIKLDKKSSAVLILVSVFIAIFTTMAVIGSGYYSMSIIPPERTLFVAIYMIILSFVGFSVGITSLMVGYKFLDSKMFFASLIAIYLVLSIFLIKSMVSHWQNVRTEIKNYAVSFDKIEPTLANSKGRDLVMKNISPVGELDSFTDNKGWVAGCLAGYYNIKKIEIKN